MELKLTTGLVLNFESRNHAGTCSLCICSLLNHRCHYTTFSVNVNSFEVIFSSDKPKKSAGCKIKIKIFVYYALVFLVLCCHSNENIPHCL